MNSLYFCYNKTEWVCSWYTWCKCTMLNLSVDFVKRWHRSTYTCIVVSIVCMVAYTTGTCVFCTVCIQLVCACFYIQ